MKSPSLADVGTRIFHRVSSPPVTGAGELGLTVPGNGSAQPRYGPGLAPRIGLNASAQTRKHGQLAA
jgi:hypothetical protein